MEITWLLFFEEMLQKVLEKYDKLSLATLALEIFGAGNFKDNFKDGSSGPIKEIDPLTFIGFFNRNQTDENRIQLCKIAKIKLDIKSDIPRSFEGIPIINPQKSWFFPFDFKRGADDIDQLWIFANKLNNLGLDSEAFSKCLGISNVGVAKLTQLAFIAKPEIYYPLDKFNIEFLKKNGLIEDAKPLTTDFNFNVYQSLLKKIKEKFPNKSFAELSHEAKMNDDLPTKYWVVGAVWGDVDKSKEFIENSEWINGWDETSENPNAEKFIEKVEQIKTGDWVAIKSSFVKARKSSSIRVKAVGQVLENAGDGRHLKVNWVFKGEAFDIIGAAYMQTVHEVTDTTDQKLIFHNDYKHHEKMNSTQTSNAIEGAIPMTQKNIILFGPPGTGKTYDSVDRAVEIVNGTKSNSRAENKETFDLLRKTGQIEFVTFHQNYSYEDFMVGIKPDTTHQDLKFKQHYGVFYKLVKTARENYLNSRSNITPKGSFKDAFNNFVNTAFEKGETVNVTMASGISFKITDINDTTIYFEKDSGSTSHTLSIQTLEDIVNGDRLYEGGLKAYYNPLAAEINKIRGRDKNLSKEVLKNYVLIIDEINRANISKVFGELITLIEEDKRIGQQNELRVTLPNGEENFCVPPNLYLIGTMNTADKSIAHIDVALRRRFDFVGYYPSYEDIPDSRASVLLEKLNANIYAKKKSTDYLIGHGYFMHKQSINDVVTKKIIPLLNEYFANKSEVISDLFQDTGWEAAYNTKTFQWEVKEI